MGPRTKELILVLEELIPLLRGAGQEHWAKWMEQSRAWILDQDFSGVEKLMQAYGGMGSLNDLVLGGKSIGVEITWDKEGRDLNKKFQYLTSKAWDLASEISRDQ